MDTEIFQQNIERWAKLHTQSALRINMLRHKRVFFVKTSQGMDNLVRKTEDGDQLLHDDNPLEEAKTWFEALAPSDNHLIFVYGVGLGYYYAAALEWLKNPQNHLIFLEDDPEVIRRLFETDLGSKIVQNLQVSLFLLSQSDSQKCMQEIQNITKVFAHIPYTISALKAYAQKSDQKAYQNLHYQLDHWIALRRACLAEFNNYGRHFYFNFYPNLIYLPEAYRCNLLQNQFKGMPAIICGAGPSMDKNLDLLENLCERALIFAGGTALNAVNSRGFWPHFGLGIDPHIPGRTRLIMHTAYEVPYIYKARASFSCMQLVHGLKICSEGSETSRLPSWFEKKMGINAPEINSGFNVVNFSFSIAKLLGCNPIILVGVDLAYSDSKSYHSGVKSHPLHPKEQNLRTKNAQEELIVRQDIYGKPVYTLWKWINESMWFASQAAETPEIVIINSTEGGIGMQNIPNIALKDAADKYLHQTHALAVRLHGEIQNCHMPEHVTLRTLINLVEELQISFKNIIPKLQALQASYQENAQKPAFDLPSEAAYQTVLEDFGNFFLAINEINKQKIILNADSTPEEKKLKINSLITAMFKYLEGGARFHVEMQDAVLEELRRHAVMLDNIVPSVQKEQNKLFAGYTFEAGKISIVDVELDIDIHEEIAPSLIPYRLYYPGGQLKFEQFYVHDQLHGPVTFFSEEGQVLGRSWYINGMQMGKMWLFYASGVLYSLQGYAAKGKQGPQFYYYPSGRIKSSLNYQQGKLDGINWLYFPTGKPTRELHFSMGEHHGPERMWNEDDSLVMEVEYSHDLPCGKARTWHPTGVLSQEITYGEGGKVESIKAWTKEGEIETPAGGPAPSYFELLVSQIQGQTKYLHDVYTQLHKVILASGAKGNNEGVQQNLILLEREMEALKLASENVLRQAAQKVFEMEEPIWHTPSAEKEGRKALGELSLKLQKDMSEFNALIQKLKILGK